MQRMERGGHLALAGVLLVLAGVLAAGGGATNVVAAIVAALVGLVLASWSVLGQRGPTASADAELTATREQLERVLANLTEAVTVTDRNRRMRYANQAAADILGC